MKRIYRMITIVRHVHTALQLRGSHHALPAVAHGSCLRRLGMTCGLIRKCCHDADPMIFGVAGASWVVAAAAYFGYLHKLRRYIEQLERVRSYTVDRGIR